MPDNRRRVGVTSALAIVALDTVGDGACECFAKARRLHTVALRFIADEATFDEDRGHVRVADHVVAGEFFLAIDGAGVADESILYLIGYFLPFAIEVKSFEAAYILLPSVIEMNTHKDRIAVAVGDLASLGKSYEIVVAAGHDRAISHAFEAFLETGGSVEGEMFFVNSPPLASEIVSTMSCINHHGAEISRKKAAKTTRQDGEENEAAHCYHGVVLGLDS